MGSTADMDKPKIRSVVVYCGSSIGNEEFVKVAQGII